jgi:hypothetical protein
LTTASFASDASFPFLVCHLSLSVLDGLPASPMSPGATSASSSAQRLLYGTLVSSPHRLRNLEGKPGVYFLFPDVSVRERGRYRLGVTLVNVMRQATPDQVYPIPLKQLTSGLAHPGAPGPSKGNGTVLATARSSSFDVVAMNDYTAPR